MAASGSRIAWYPGFKLAVYALLACNTAIFIVHGTLFQALDAAAWFALLTAFALEIRFPRLLCARYATIAVRAARAAAAAAICAAAFGYGYEHEWLDTVNTALWIAVVVLLELEVRHPPRLARHRAWFVAAAIALYASLAALVPVWAAQGAWFDAYDALLWLAAFATIEMDALKNFRDTRAVRA